MWCACTCMLCGYVCGMVQCAVVMCVWSVCVVCMCRGRGVHAARCISGTWCVRVHMERGVCSVGTRGAVWFEVLCVVWHAVCTCACGVGGCICCVVSRSHHSPPPHTPGPRLPPPARWPRPVSLCLQGGHCGGALRKVRAFLRTLREFLWLLTQAVRRSLASWLGRCWNPQAPVPGLWLC